MFPTYEKFVTGRVEDFFFKLANVTLKNPRPIERTI